ncbi:glycosyltransferase [Calothrix sp. PCC 6303]|uniref:glycosyltransferase n=1 Tax=Calothrix sp. PCC 6303 TaxID=1170562 RepID=UPI0002A04945|nr:glycosyltransferase [Calothrix sp. PCC 6303]AFZ00757.1 glycosyl transferase group 1 [Calothrix sp. PCC 6303]
MQTTKPLKIVICTDYLGYGAVEGSFSGFQKVITDWISKSTSDPNIQIIVYCLGTEEKVYRAFNSVLFKQYKPHLSNRTILPLVSPHIFPFLLDIFPIHSKIIKDIIHEKPDVIHTFQTFGVTELAGFIAAKIMKMRKQQVTLINTVMCEIDTYAANYMRRVVISFYKIIDSSPFFKIVADSVDGGSYLVKSTNPSRQVRSVLYTISAASAYYLFLNLSLLGQIQDFLVKAVRFIYKLILQKKYPKFESEVKLAMNSIREPFILSRYREKNFSLFKLIAKPFQLVFDFLRRGDELGKQPGLAGILGNTLGVALKQQISLFVNQCDRVTISRHEDIGRYSIKSNIWEVPLGYDTAKFKVYQPNIDELIFKVEKSVAIGNLSAVNAKKLIDFISHPMRINQRCFIYVGRLSDEKNISLLLNACERLLHQDNLQNQVHFLFIGTGFAASEIASTLGSSATIIDFVPNYLLPDIYNFLRQNSGFFISASDTETYGITHGEAAACGLPLIGMERGSRGHFFCPGDKVGKLVIEDEEKIAKSITEIVIESGNNNLMVALNGLYVSDTSYGLGLSRLPVFDLSRILAQESLFVAMYMMALLPDSIYLSMSDCSANLSIHNQFSSDESWELMKYVYVNDWISYNFKLQQKKHIF